MNEDTFLPEDYTPPVSGGGYMKLKDGDNLIRILSKAIIGYEYWNKDNKPIRNRIGWSAGVPDDIRIDKDGNQTKIKHFWAFVVWNYETKNVEILEITQATIQQAINNLVKDEDWGDPKQYDIKITRTGEGFDTTYSVSPKPAKPLSSEIGQAYENKKINLEALYSGENPFA